MCTVTFYPTDSGYILTHNRDEMPLRSPIALSVKKESLMTMIYPQDQQAHGTWIFIQSKGVTACLINGAYENHTKRSSYRMSRGKVMLHLAQCNHVASWIKTYDLDQIEPFTLIILQDQELIELIWDGSEKHIRYLGMRIPTIWSSTTLYSEEHRHLRKQLFYQWIDRIKDYDPAAWMYRFHEAGTVGDIRNNIRMYRQGGPCTVSTTQVIADGNSVHMLYHDLIHDSKTTAQFKVKKINIQNRKLLHV